ncbi:hypothetical protein CJ030_MR8G002638 [Morella rubra]|uniref:Uncharacterized protein n=1 Tax=Morella rubra TaxID=262757 RepID=A0A6A1V0E0_9ROSI|nr:hypothetical protein CJ030_MR8G002638 [Morella rubra]
MFNRSFGATFLTDTGQESAFAYHIHQYADVYTSKPENFLFYPPEAWLHAPFDIKIMPHHVKFLSASQISRTFLQICSCILFLLLRPCTTNHTPIVLQGCPHPLLVPACRTVLASPPAGHSRASEGEASDDFPFFHFAFNPLWFLTRWIVHILCIKDKLPTYVIRSRVTIPPSQLTLRDPTMDPINGLTARPSV